MRSESTRFLGQPRLTKARVPLGEVLMRGRGLFRVWGAVDGFSAGGPATHQPSEPSIASLSYSRTAARASSWAGGRARTGRRGGVWPEREEKRRGCHAPDRKST